MQISCKRLNTLAEYKCEGILFSGAYSNSHIIENKGKRGKSVYCQLWPRWADGDSFSEEPSLLSWQCQLFATSGWGGGSLSLIFLLPQGRERGVAICDLPKLWASSATGKGRQEKYYISWKRPYIRSAFHVCARTKLRQMHVFDSVCARCAVCYW